MKGESRMFRKSIPERTKRVHGPRLVRSKLVVTDVCFGRSDESVGVRNLKGTGNRTTGWTPYRTRGGVFLFVFSEVTKL